MREKIKKLTDAQFKIHRAAVNNIVTEIDLKLLDEYQKQTYELETSKYLWDRQQKTKKVLRSIKKEELAEFFDQIFFSEKSKRLDLSLTSPIHAKQQEECREKNKSHEIFEK